MMSGRPTSRPDSLAGRALISVRVSIGKQESRRAVIHTAPLAQDRMGANNLQQSWRFDWEPPKAVLRDVWTIVWILGC
jgi:tryptophan-rich sensory protein